MLDVPQRARVVTAEIYEDEGAMTFFGGRRATPDEGQGSI